LELERAPHPTLRIVEPAPEELRLVRAAMRGDDAATEKLYLRCAPDLRRWVSHVVLGADDAQDIVQDTFVSAFTQLKRLKHPEAFRPWLRTIALTQMRRRFRRQRLLRRLGFSNAEPLEMESVLSNDAPPEVVVEVRSVAVLLRQLSADEGLALSLRRIEGYSLEEIAEHMNLSLATVKRRLAAAQAHFDALQEAHP
jgi:RNA polymerase sigma-70 factor, ECF subfamily